jgi:hypothetical protein
MQQSAEIDVAAYAGEGPSDVGEDTRSFFWIDGKLLLWASVHFVLVLASDDST